MRLFGFIRSIALGKVQECLKRTPNAKVMTVFNQVAHSIGKRRETILALNFLSDAQAIGDELVVFLIHPFDSFRKSPTMPQTVTKC